MSEHERRPPFPDDDLSSDKDVANAPHRWLVGFE
jgi:hypothetical protein